MRHLLSGLFLLIVLLLHSTANAQTARIENITLRGNQRTYAPFLESLVTSKAGAPLDSARLEKDVQMLIRLPSVAHAYYQVFHSHGDLYKVYITIEENFTLIPYFNLWTRGERVWWTAGASEHNLLGRNMMLDVFYQNNGKHSYGITYRAPFLLDAKWGIALSFKDFTADEPVYFGEITGIYEYKNRSMEALLLYQLNFYHRLELGGSYFRETYTFVSGAEEIIEKPQLLRLDKYLFKAFHQYYRVVQYYQYFDGFISDFQFQHVQALQSNLLPFNMLDYGLRFYKRTGEKGNMGARALLGFSTNNETPFAAYVVDNHANVRGVGDRVNRASAVFALNAEYRHTLWENDWFAFQGVGFADFASFRSPGAEFASYVSPENLYLNTGLGTRFILKRVYSATLRIDYGAGLLENNAQGLVIGLGQYF